MEISDTARNIIVTYIRGHLDGEHVLLPADDLADKIGARASALGSALEEVGAWCGAFGLPDISSSIIDPDQADHNVMLPMQDVVSRLGGEALARAEQARVRDYDWDGWLES